MTSLLTVASINLAVIMVYVSGQWLASLYTKDASLVDRFWGAGFVLVAFATFFQTGYDSPRDILLLVLVTIWGARLSIYITVRNWGEGEDRRYTKMRERHGHRFALVSLCTVFLLQGMLTWIIAWPLQAGIYASGPDTFTLLDWVGVFVWIVGFLFESIGDYQLARFRADPDNSGKVMDRGLWRYTRHPNYFGDALLWWGMFLVAASVPNGAYTVFAPIVMQFFLMRVSGVTLLERSLKKSRPGYEEYVRRTNSFFPWFPKHS